MYVYVCMYVCIYLFVCLFDGLFHCLFVCLLVCLLVCSGFQFLARSHRRKHTQTNKQYIGTPADPQAQCYATFSVPTSRGGIVFVLFTSRNAWNQSFYFFVYPPPPFPVRVYRIVDMTIQLTWRLRASIPAQPQEQTNKQTNKQTQTNKQANNPM